MFFILMEKTHEKSLLEAFPFKNKEICKICLIEYWQFDYIITTLTVLEGWSMLTIHIKHYLKTFPTRARKI